jgi:hypothetical protein
MPGQGCRYPRRVRPAGPDPRRVDLLFISLWPLAAAKAYSATAGLAAMVVPMGCVAVTTTLTLAGLLTGAIPTMVLVGPAIAAHDGAVIASGDDAAAVIADAGRQEPNVVPVLVFTRG